jgi:hypothetical protein
MSLNSLLAKSVVFGFVLSILSAVAVSASAAVGFTALLAAAIAFGSPAAYLLHLAIPSAALYSVFPEGGGAAFVGLALMGALIQLFVVLTALSYALWFARRQRVVG